MNQMLADGATLLYVSHSLESVKKICKKAAWMERGSVRLTGDAIQVCDAYEEAEL